MLGMEERYTLKEFLRGINRWWEDEKFRFDVIEREEYMGILEKNPSRLIDILIGARRVGKTSLVHSYINRLLEKVDSKTVIYLPADLKEIRERGIRKILEIVSKDFKYDIFKKQLYVFVDEVQEIPEWQREVKFLYDNTKIRFFLTGSSSLILKEETSKLTGRFLLHQILTLRYPEFLRFRKLESSEKNLMEYLNKGGYPEYVLNQSIDYLQQAVESTLYRELLEIYGIRNPSILKNLLGYLTDKVTNPVSANRIAVDLKIDDKTAKFYLEYLESVYLIYPVYRYGRSHKKTKGSLPKYYFNDNGVLSLFGVRDRLGHLVENAVFLELLRKERAELSNIYYDVINENEVDFRVGQNLYEVKAKEMSESEILKYEGIKENINIVSLEKQKDIYLPNLKYVDLEDFLL